MVGTTYDQEHIISLTWEILISKLLHHRKINTERGRETNILTDSKSPLVIHSSCMALNLLYFRRMHT